jgi:hypothetical protein
MAVLDRQNNLAIGATPYRHSWNAPRDVVLSLANNTVAGAPSGVDLTVTTLDGDGRYADYLVAYGTTRKIPVPGLQWVQLSGNGANVTYYAATEPIDVQVTNVPAVTATIPGTVTVSVPGTVTVDGSVAANATIVSPLTAAGSVKTFAEPS